MEKFALIEKIPFSLLFSISQYQLALKHKAGVDSGHQQETNLDRREDFKLGLVKKGREVEFAQIVFIPLSVQRVFYLRSIFLITALALFSLLY